MNVSLLALGSNMGDREHYLREAIELLSKHGNVKSVSSFIETAPMYLEEQERFLNAAIEFHTNLEPQELLNTCLDIEQELGRVRVQKNGPRTIDIDILFYNNDIIETDELTIPHPLLHERRFVLEPLAEISPQMQHPVHNKSIQQLLDLLG